MHDKERQNTLHAQIMGQSVIEQKSIGEKSSKDLESFPIPALLCLHSVLDDAWNSKKKLHRVLQLPRASIHKKRANSWAEKNRKKLLSSLWRVEVALLLLLSMLFYRGRESGKWMWVCGLDGAFRVLNSLILKYLRSPPLIEISSEPKKFVYGKKIENVYANQLSPLLDSINSKPKKPFAKYFGCSARFLLCLWVCMHVESAELALCIENSVFYTCALCIARPCAHSVCYVYLKYPINWGYF